jgi:hypothetical protein
LWPVLPFPDEVHAIRSRCLWLLNDEPLQGGDDLQRHFGPELLPLGDDEARLLLRRRPMQLSASQAVQCLRQDLIAVAAQLLDVDQVANCGDGPVAAIAGRVLHELDVVGGEGEAGSPRIGAHLIAVGGAIGVDATATACVASVARALMAFLAPPEECSNTTLQPSSRKKPTKPIT